MKIKMWLPVGASAEFEADIDVEGKTSKEVFDEFMQECQPTGYLCHHCSDGIQSDYEILEDNVHDEWFIEEIEEDWLQKDD
ncbi:MAG: hypothetical protein GY714_18170 [Desulfobacterales bacterium]|nr:hypothetical protein [Desulfobacterales bacterium]